MEGTYFLGNGEFETRVIKEHSLAPTEVLIKIAACGVCGTDVHIYHGDKGSAEVTPPVILGHEISGIVEAIGEKVDLVEVGDHVSIDPNIYCGECEYCRLGKKQLCENLFAIGVNRDGGFADYCYVPQSQCFKLNEDIPLEQGAMAEPLACCIHGIDRLQIKHGDSVCIIGGGAIGLILVQLAKLAGASSIILSEIIESRRNIGLKLGADFVINPLEAELNSSIERLIGTKGTDVVIECVGNTVATAQAFEAAKKGARILLFSVPKAGTTHPLSLEDVFHKELTILGSIINPDTHKRAVEMINSHRLDLGSLITHFYPHQRIKEAILMQMKPESLKVIIR